MKPAKVAYRLLVQTLEALTRSPNRQRNLHMEEPSNPTDPLAEAAKETAALVDSPLAEALEGDALSGDIHALEGDATKAWADIQQFIADGRKRIDAALAPIAGAQPSVAAAISAAFHELMQHVATKHPAAPAPPSDGSAAE